MKSQKTLILAINIAALMVLMDLSAINIALPNIREHFDLSVQSVSLILMASMLSATGSALIMGKIIELFQAGRILVIAFAIFGLTTTASAYTTHFYELIALRFIQGFAEAALYVIGPALIKKYIEINRQQKEYGIWMMSCGIGISLGPIIGGFLVNYFQWNTVFLINLPLAIAGIIVSLKLNKQLVFQKVQKNSFDIKGAVYSFLFLSFLIIFFNMLGIVNANFVLLVVLFSFSLLFLFLFIKQEKKALPSLLNLKLFSIKNFRLANIGFFLFFFVNVGNRFLRPFYFEETRGWGSINSGLLMMIPPGIMLVISFYIDKFDRIFTTKQLVISGNILLSISMLMFSFWNINTSIYFITTALIILGLAMGIYYPATSHLGMQSLPSTNYGTGSASMSISKSFGKLMGVLLFGLLFQVFFEWLNLSSSPSDYLQSISIQYVFILGFIISLINTGISLNINSLKK